MIRYKHPGFQGFLPATDVEALTRLAEKYGVLDIASEVLSNPDFSTWSASSHSYQHHYGKGQLARHTREVVELSLANALLFKTKYDYSERMPSEKEIYLAALFHDIGKIYDYKEIRSDNHIGVSNWEGTHHKRRIHHISRSGIIWSRAVDKYPTYRDIEETVLHAILAHHGTREWGSPVAPNTRLAWLIHFCDCMSARMNDADTLDVTKHYKT